MNFKRLVDYKLADACNLVKTTNKSDLLRIRLGLIVEFLALKIKDEISQLFAMIPRKKVLSLIPFHECVHQGELAIDRVYS
jgi:hypothetical protein